MRVGFVVALFLFLLIASTMSACTSQAPVNQVDSPMLSSQEAISIAQEHCASSPINRDEAIACRYSQVLGNQGWRATYLGNGKWTIEFTTSGGRYHWTVLEATQKAMFLGRF
jgi:hypothetical protein